MPHFFRPTETTEPEENCEEWRYVPTEFAQQSPPASLPFLGEIE